MLKWLANRFEFDERYSETQVNEIIKRYHPDSAYFRRELIGEKLMQRDQGIYWRISTDNSEREKHVAWLRSLARRFEYGQAYEDLRLTRFYNGETRRYRVHFCATNWPPKTY